MNTKKQKGFQSLETLINSSDLDWIQTSNLLSRNQVRYSVAPQGHLQVVVITSLRVQI